MTTTAQRVLSDYERRLMIHALGLTPRCGRVRRWAYRNRFVAGRGTLDHTVWSNFVRTGLATSKDTGHIAPDSVTFWLTAEGVAALGKDVERRVPKSLIPKAKVPA